MRLTARTRYAVAAMVELARHESQGPVSLREVSKRQNISLSYLEPMFSLFRKSGLVRSTRGPGGGYSLGRTSDAINVAEIVSALNEDIYSSPEVGQCDLSPYSLTADIWKSMNCKAMAFLRTVSLASLVPDVCEVTVATSQKTQVVRGVQVQRMVQSLPKNVPNSVFAIGQLAFN